MPDMRLRPVIQENGEGGVQFATLGAQWKGPAGVGDSITFDNGNGLVVRVTIDSVEVKDVLPIEPEWDDDLIWCPSQCLATIEWDGVKYELYLRWRWDDPWQFQIKSGGEFVSGDLFAEAGVFHLQFDDLDEIKQDAIALFRVWAKENG